MSQPTSIAEVVAEAGRKTLEALAARHAPQPEAEPKAAEPEAKQPEQPEQPQPAEPKSEEPKSEAPAEQPGAEPATEPAAAPEGESKGVAFKAVCVDDQGVIIGIGASIATDKQDESVNKAALIGLAYDFCASNDRTFRYNHYQKANVGADLVSSWPGAPVLKSGKILAPGEAVPDGDPVVAINIEKGKETHWFVGVKPHDASILDAVRKGEISGFSWGGFAKKVAQ